MMNDSGSTSRDMSQCRDDFFRETRKKFDSALRKAAFIKLTIRRPFAKAGEKVAKSPPCRRNASFGGIGSHQDPDNNGAK
jgi:hypothetical protein